jgi:hypothetical protein
MIFIDESDLNFKNMDPMDDHLLENFKNIYLKSRRP